MNAHRPACASLVAGNPCDCAGPLPAQRPAPGSSGSIVRDHVLAVPALAHVTLPTDIELLRKLVESIGRSDKPRGCPLWSHVGARLGHGAGVSQAICRALGLDPDKSER